MGKPTPYALLQGLSMKESFWPAQSVLIIKMSVFQDIVYM